MFGKKTDDLIKSAMAVDLEKTIFDDDHGWIGEVMKGAYCVANPVGAVIDLLIWWWNK